jgi:creatinine amidohydrolase
MSATGKVRYELMYPSEFTRAVGECPVAYVPMGLLEWHGEHLPLGVDGLKSHGMCVALARAVGGGVVLPPFYVGRPGFTSFPGTMTYSDDVVRGMLTGCLRELEKLGFRVVLVLAGHYGRPQKETIAAAVDEFTSQSEVKVWYLAEDEAVRDLGYRGDHGGPWETSMTLASVPDVVRLEEFRPGRQEIDEYKIEPGPGRYEFELGGLEFSWEEDLRQTVSADDARKKFSDTVQAIARRLREMLSGSASGNEA